MPWLTNSALLETSAYLLIARKKKPKAQFTTEPKILPKDANIRRNKIDIAAQSLLNRIKRKALIEINNL